MDAHQVRVERRPAQRFELQLPVTICQAGHEQPSYGYTQNVSARGAFFYTDALLVAGEHVDVAFLMPSEITLAEPAPVSCRGKVVRIQPPEGGTTFGVAVQFEGYEYLPEHATSATGTFGRIWALRRRPYTSEPAEVESASPPPRTVALP